MLGQQAKQLYCGSDYPMLGGNFVLYNGSIWSKLWAAMGLCLPALARREGTSPHNVLLLVERSCSALSLTVPPHVRPVNWSTCFSPPHPTASSSRVCVGGGRRGDWSHSFPHPTPHSATPSVVGVGECSLGSCGSAN